MNETPNVSAYKQTDTRKHKDKPPEIVIRGLHLLQADMVRYSFHFLGLK